MIYDHQSDTVDALVQAESFISGFEGDPGQAGIADILAGLRAAIPREQARPDGRLSTEQLRVLADAAFTILNWAKRQGLDRERQIDEVVKTFEVTLGYRKPFEARADVQTDEVREAAVAWAWDRLVADGWTPPHAPTSAISEIMARRVVS